MTVSSYDQMVIAPDPKNLEQYAVWRNIGAEEPFNFGRPPLGIFDTLPEAVRFATEQADGKAGMRFIIRDNVVEYKEFTYLGLVTK